MTIVKRLSTNFTGDQTGVPTLLAASGVAGYSNRWLAADQPGVESDPITTLVAAAGVLPMTQATSTKRPTIHIESALKMLRFDGTDDDMETPTDVATVKTISVVVRNRDASGLFKGLFSPGGATVTRTNPVPSKVEVTFTGGSATLLDVNMLDNKFHVITVVGDLANSQRAFAADAAYIGSLAGTAGNQFVRLGRTGSGGYGINDYLEVITWPFALTQAQCLAVYTAMKTNYGAAVVA